MTQPPPAGGSTAFLLAQIGAHAARRFAERVAEVELTPPQAGLLRAIARQPGLSQAQYATHLGVPPSRFVLLVDGLEQRGLVARQRNDTDRRSYGLHLTADGRALMRRLGAIARAHDDELLDGLTADERQQLQRFLATIAERQGLTPGVHPGYRTL
jgi:DNA-binding MarR family transcriptional regulator